MVVDARCNTFLALKRLEQEWNLDKELNCDAIDKEIEARSNAGWNYMRWNLPIQVWIPVYIYKLTNHYEAEGKEVFCEDDDSNVKITIRW